MQHLSKSGSSSWMSGLTESWLIGCEEKKKKAGWEGGNAQWKKHKEQESIQFCWNSIMAGNAQKRYASSTVAERWRAGSLLCFFCHGSNFIKPYYKATVGNNMRPLQWIRVIFAGRAALSSCAHTRVRSGKQHECLRGHWGNGEGPCWLDSPGGKSEASLTHEI